MMILKYFVIFLMGYCLSGNYWTLSPRAMEMQDHDHFKKTPYELRLIIATHAISFDENFSAIYSLRQISKQWKAVAEETVSSSGRLVIPLSPTNYKDQNWIGHGVVPFATGIKLVGWDPSNAHLIAEALTSLSFNVLKIKCIAYPSLLSYTGYFHEARNHNENRNHTQEWIKEQCIYYIKSQVSESSCPVFVMSGPAPYMDWQDKLKPRYIYNLSLQQIASAFDENKLAFLNEHLSDDLGEEGIASLTSVLHYFVNLEELRLWSFTSIGKKGGEALGWVLQYLPKLRYIDVHGAMGPKGCNAFARGLGYASHLISLDLEGNGIGNEACQTIVQQFHNLPNLRHVNFSYVSLNSPGGNDNFITREGGISLAQGIHQHPNIVSFILVNHPIGSEGLLAFMDLGILNRKGCIWNIHYSDIG